MTNFNIRPILSYLNEYDSNPESIETQNFSIKNSLELDTSAEGFLDMVLLQSPTLEQTILEYSDSLHKQVIDSDRLKDCLNFLNRQIWYAVSDTKYLTAIQVISLAFDQMMSIIRSHPFNDGNKRTGVVAFFFILKRVFSEDFDLSSAHQYMMAYSLVKMLEGDDVLKARDLWRDIVILQLVRQDIEGWSFLI